MVTTCNTCFDIENSLNFINRLFLVLRMMIKNDNDCLDAFAKLRKVAISFVMSVCLSVCLSSVRPYEWNNSAPTGRIFMKFDIWVFFENLSRIFKFHYNLTGITCTLREDQCTFLIKSRPFRLRMRNISNKVVGKIKTHILFFSNFHRKSRLLRNNVEKYSRAGDRPYGPCALHVGYLRLQTHTLRICNT